MTTVGWVGLGRLGLPCALALASRGVTVAGYDINPARRSAFRGVSLGDEPGIEDAWTEATRQQTIVPAVSIADVVRLTDGLVFVAVQTPHAPAYGGDRPAPLRRQDFDYEALRAAAREVNEATLATDRFITLVIVSTVLPGTLDREIRPLLTPHFVRLAYNPAFPAMGSVIADFTNPAFILVGADENDAVETLGDLYAKAGIEADIHPTSIASAELAKVAYNTFITTKITFANALMEICDHTAADVDEVTSVLAAASDRITSARYLTGGMGDGGPCHPRDLIALSWLSDRLGLSYDWFGRLVEAREAQTEWLAQLAVDQAHLHSLAAVWVLGRAYKPDTALTDGSPALLLLHYIRADRSVHVRSAGVRSAGVDTRGTAPAVYIVATPHPEFLDWEFPAGSVVIDPWRQDWNRQPDVTYIRVGAS